VIYDNILNFDEYWYSPGRELKNFEHTMFKLLPESTNKCQVTSSTVKGFI